MTKFGRTEIVGFLHTLDDFLEENLAVCLIGGGAAVLGYQADIQTADLDFFDTQPGTIKLLRKAGQRATAATGVDLTIDPASIAQLPYGYVERLRRARGAHFRKLIIWVPDKYDLVLSKSIRCHPHDIEAILSIHAHHPLSEKTLATRFEKEIWKEAVTDPRKFAFHMTLVMGALFGKDRVERYKRRWGLT